MEITLLHHLCQFTPDGDYPTTPPLLMYPRWRLLYYTTPANLPQMKVTLLHHPLIDPWWRLPYYTTPANLPQMKITLLHTSANLPQMEITLLHHPC